uniref:DH domain-containing protein n=1 Tax=Arcella intermedia TaxID=1963864 RepID=A0A6B2L220_9EUKA
MAKRSQFRQTVKDYADSEPGRIGYTRIKILFEFLSTEQSYVKGLNTAIEEWLRPLKANLETKNAVCTKKEVNKIFGSIEVVRNINAEFLARITYWLKVKFPHTAGFADLLLTIAPALNLYVDYVNNYDEARDTFEKLKENNSDFVNWMNNRKSQSGLVGDLSNLLITPVQRVPRYELLIRELIKHTSEKHMDYPLLNKAKEEFVQVNKKVNAKKREQETRQKLVQIERSIVSAAPLILVAPHRMYIKDGLLKFTFKNETLTGIVYILNDCIVLTQAVLKIKDKTVNLFKKTETSPQGTTENHYLETVSLKDLEILYDPNQLQFSLQQGESKYDFLFDTEDNKREWYTSFKEAIDAYALTALFEVAFSKEDKNFYVISAIYGKLRTGTTSTDKSDQIDVTSNILKIIEQQGGNQLILNSGSKSKLFNYTGAKKVKKQLKITCSIKQQVKEFIFQDTEGFVLNADSEPNNK